MSDDIDMRESARAGEPVAESEYTPGAPTLGERMAEYLLRRMARGTDGGDGA